MRKFCIYKKKGKNLKNFYCLFDLSNLSQSFEP